VASILIVEDEASVARLLEVTLADADHGDHDIEIFDRGETAVARLDGPPADLVVLDVMLPGIDGLAVLKELRANPAWSSTKVVMLTALGRDEDVWRGWVGGADYYLTKPFDVGQLRSVATRLLLGEPVDVSG
jgi:DNA-binding response OmpR family regulator